jgi:hypothetical protein
VRLAVIELVARGVLTIERRRRRSYLVPAGGCPRMSSAAAVPA